MGLMLGVELVRDRADEGAGQRPRRPTCWNCARSAACCIGKGGLFGNTLRIKPPMCLTHDDADFLVDCLDEVIEVLSSRS